jgi:hypothetical protein
LKDEASNGNPFGAEKKLFPIFWKLVLYSQLGFILRFIYCQQALLPELGINIPVTPTRYREHLLLKIQEPSQVHSQTSETYTNSCCSANFC